MSDSLKFDLSSDPAKAVADLVIHPVVLASQRIPVVDVDDSRSFKLTSAGAYWFKIVPDGLGVVFPLDVVILAGEKPAEPDSGKRLAEFHFEYQLIYTFSKEIALFTNEQLESFAAFYGANHCWPYARAELQTATAKLRLPPLTLPILRMGTLPAGFTISEATSDDEEPR